MHAGNDTEFETDTGYIGITAIHPNLILPKSEVKTLLLPKKKKEAIILFSRKESMWNMPSGL